MGKPENVERHQKLCEELNELYERKNHDYGDSFHETFSEEGYAAARIRLGDKFKRFKKLTLDGVQYVSDETIRDTLIDLANYELMTVMEVDRHIEQTERISAATAKCPDLAELFPMSETTGV